MAFIVPMSPTRTYNPNLDGQKKDFWKNKRVLVTGGNGFLGSHVVDKLKERGSIVFAPRKIDFDIRTKTDAYNILSLEPDIVLHLAATCGGIGANAARPADYGFDNLVMGLNVIDACAYQGVQKLVLIGTTCSYPADTPLPLKEEDIWDGYPEATNAPYGIAKRALLTMAQAYRAQYGLNSIYLIPANLYGPRDNFDLETSHVIPAIIRKCVQAVTEGQETVSLWGDGTPTREFLYVEDCAEAILLAAERYDGAEPVNVGTGFHNSIAYIAQEIALLTGFTGRFVWDTDRPNGQACRVLDTTRARQEFGFRAKTPLETGLRCTIEWYITQIVHPDSVGLPLAERVRAAV